MKFLNRKPKDGKLTTPHVVNTTQVYSDDEEEFIRAVAAFRAKMKRPPTLLEGFAIAKSLGWRQ